MSDLNGKKEMRQFSAADLRKICLEVGADDVGFVNIDREALQKEREGILRVYLTTFRTSFARKMLTTSFSRIFPSV